MKKNLYVLIAILSLIFVSACSAKEDESKEEKPQKIVVETGLVEQSDFNLEKSFYGKTRPVTSSPVIAKSPGEIDSLKVSNGTKVTKDKLLAVIKTPMGKQNIYAQQSGIIGQLTASVGDFITNTDPLLVIADVNELKIDLAVTDQASKLFNKDIKLTADINGQAYEATVTSIGVLPNETGMYPVELKLENKDAEIFAGVVAEVYVVEKRFENTLKVPTEAIIKESDKAYIYLFEDGKAVQKDVEILETQTDQTAIQADIKAGDSVITSGKRIISDGSKVQVLKDSGAGDAS